MLKDTRNGVGRLDTISGVAAETRSFGVGFPLGRELVLAARTRLRTRFFRLSKDSCDRIGPARWLSVTEVGKDVEVKEQGSKTSW